MGLSVTGAVRGGEAGAGGPAPSFEEPFAADSCWKTPIAADANYRDVQFEFGKFDHPAGIYWKQWTVGVFKAAASDPEVTVHLKDMWTAVAKEGVKNFGNSPEVEANALAGSYLEPRFGQPPWATRATMPYDFSIGGYQAKIHCPAGARPSPDSDGHLAVLQPDGKTLFEAYCAVVLGNGDILCSMAGFVDITGPGDGTQCGLRASMIPAIGGLIRKGELERGEIPHALSCMLYSGCMKWGSHVWPAISHDTRSEYNGSIPMGSRFAIPRDVDLEKLGLSPKGLTIARAIQRYGMFLVDRGGQGMSIEAELGNEAAEIKEWWTQDAAKIMAHLAVVTPPAGDEHYEEPKAVVFDLDVDDINGVKKPEANWPPEPILRVGEGGEFKDIASAIAALPAGGGNICMAAGTYEISETLRLPSNVLLAGEGADKTIIKMAAGKMAHVIANADPNGGNCNIGIVHLAIVGNLDSRGTPPQGKPTQGKDECRGVYFKKVQDAWVKNCLLSETGSNSFRADDCRRIGFVDNVEQYCFHCLNFTACTDCIVAGNRVYRKWSGEAPYLNDSHHVAIIGNWVEGVGMDGMTLDFNSSGNYVRGNTIVGAALSGILIARGSHDNVLLRNTVRNCGQYQKNPLRRIDGIFLADASRNRIEGNFCLDDQAKPTQRYGINISGARCEGNVLKDNRFRGNASGDVSDLGTGTEAQTQPAK